MSEFYKELDRRETQAKADRLSNRPENIHEYQGCAKHTPGPWHYQKESDAYTHIVRDCEGAMIASTPQWSNGIAEANARLIAAAPELLEALKAWEELFMGDFAIRLVSNRPITNGDQDVIDAVITKARNAIAKATNI